MPSIRGIGKLPKDQPTDCPNKQMRSVGRSFGRSVVRSVVWSFGRLVVRSFGHSFSPTLELDEWWIHSTRTQFNIHFLAVFIHAIYSNFGENTFRGMAASVFRSPYLLSVVPY